MKTDRRCVALAGAVWMQATHFNANAAFVRWTWTPQTNTSTNYERRAGQGGMWKCVPVYIHYNHEHLNTRIHFAVYYTWSASYKFSDFPIFSLPCEWNLIAGTFKCSSCWLLICMGVKLGPPTLTEKYRLRVFELRRRWMNLDLRGGR